MPDRESQTEAPSERRIQRAREEGDIAISRDLASWATLATAAIALMLQGESLRQELVTLLRAAAGGLDRLAWDELVHRLWPLFAHGLELIATLAAVAVAVGVTQTRAGFWPELVGPRFDRLISGGPLRRIAKGELFVDMGLGVVKTLAIGAAIWSALSGEFLTLVRLPGADIAPQLHKVAGLLGSAVQRSLLVLAFFAGTDFALVYFRNRSKLKMTKDELKRETKEEDGDPLMRARRRRKHRELAKGHVRVAVPRADALVVNPTHIAIAIRYRRGEDRAPRVIAKGKGVLAELMRELAREHSIAIVEDIPLARLLYRRVKIGGEVPAQTYKAVAAVLAFVYRVTGRSRQLAGVRA
jgi:flagellar biosynthetic protein FlhB